MGVFEEEVYIDTLSTMLSFPERLNSTLRSCDGMAGLTNKLTTMAYGIIEYDKEGKPKCEICGKYFHRVITHVRQKHFLTTREYKEAYGFDVKKGICSLQSKEKSHNAVMANFDRVVRQNLMEGGKHSRFQKGGSGRTKEQVSEQTRRMLMKRFDLPI